jgi:hypothetical protein
MSQIGGKYNKALLCPQANKMCRTSGGRAVDRWPVWRDAPPVSYDASLAMRPGERSTIEVAIGLRLLDSVPSPEALQLFLARQMKSRNEKVRIRGVAELVPAYCQAIAHLLEPCLQPRIKFGQDLPFTSIQCSQAVSAKL